MSDALINEAKKMRGLAYANYSNFKVGAALESTSGKVYGGCNIENASYSLTCCAERVAIFKAISAGDTNFKAMAVVGDTEDVISPCGACRQVMAEFFKEDVTIYLSNLKGLVEVTNITKLLPNSFQL